MSLADDAFVELAELARAHAARATQGSPPAQPIHTVYGGAHLFRAGIAARLGQLALAALDAHAPDAFAFASVFGLPGADALPADAAGRRTLREEFARGRLRAQAPELWLPLAVHERVLAKLRREPVEDYRIDFEDGFGVRSDAEEDEATGRAAAELGRGLAEGSLPRRIGIRIKALGPSTAARAVRTLERFVDGALAAGGLPADFVVTLPKVELPAEAATLARLLDRLELRHGLRSGSLRFEIMIESPAALADPRALVEACEGRCAGVHFGTYDYTAACGIVASEQRMDHPSARFALERLRVALAESGVPLSDGATALLPVGDTASVHAGWRRAYLDVRGSLEIGYAQGWDLHPAQLPARYAAHHAFFLEALEPSIARMRSFLESAARASRLGAHFDDAATGQALLHFFRRGYRSGALDEADLGRAALRPEDLEARSFAEVGATPSS